MNRKIHSNYCSITFIEWDSNNVSRYPGRTLACIEKHWCIWSISNFWREKHSNLIYYGLSCFPIKGVLVYLFFWKFRVYRIKVLDMHPSNQVLLSAVNWNLVAMIKHNPVLFIILLWNRSLVSCVCSVIPVHLHILDPILCLLSVVLVWQRWDSNLLPWGLDILH